MAPFVYLYIINTDIMALHHKRKLENYIYIGAWLVVMALYILGMMRMRSYTSQPLLDWDVLRHILLGMLPFVLLFMVNNSVLIPRLLFRNRYAGYFLFAVALIAVVWGFQAYYFYDNISQNGHPRHVGLPRGPRPLLPLPLLLDILYDMFIIGANLTVALVFQRFEDKLEQEQLLKTNAENQLAYLKAQINPHFYMNMLNNIHGMIEINQERAQEMVIDMSNLMRYMLYDGSQPRISLLSEIRFLKNYLNLMRQRYPEDRVRISADFPDEKVSTGVMVPPLLFLVFIENSFKHGISYREDSYVSVSIELSGDTVEFKCLNSVQETERKTNTESGIGLRNVTQRLNLIYGEGFRINIRQTDTSYMVNLIIPSNENTHSDNRR